MDRFGSSGEGMYAVLIGDVVESRESLDRKQLQKRLLQTIRLVNQEWDGLVVPVALTAGDEIQALLREPYRAVDLVIELTEAIHPDRFLFGLGYGTLSTDLHRDVGQIDGACFHQARAALHSATGEDWLVARGFGSAEDRLLTSCFGLMGVIRKRWTLKQLTYARAARTKPQKDVAEELGVAPSTVSESLKAASFAPVSDAEQAIAQWLRQFAEKTEPTGDSVKQPK